MKNFKELREKYRSKFPPSLIAAAVKIALDMAGAMTPAVKKIEAMKKGLSNDPMVKDALRMANESVNEKMSVADKKKRLEMIRKAVEKLNAKQDAQAKKDALAAIKAMESVNEAASMNKVMTAIQKDLKKEKIRSMKDLDRYLDYSGGDIIFDMESDENKANDLINKVKDKLKKQFKIK